MDTIYIAVKFSGRAFGGRAYSVTGGQFNEMLNTIKQLGGRYDGAKKIWFVTKETRDELKKSYTVQADDFKVDCQVAPHTQNGKAHVWAEFSNRINDQRLSAHRYVSANDPRDVNPLETMAAVIDGFLAAYSTSDDALKAYIATNKDLF